MAAIVAAFIATWLGDTGAAFERFAKVNDRIREGELWRLVTPIFLHAGLLPVSVNVFALRQLGPTVEQLYGRGKFLLFFLSAGVAGCTASFLFTAAPSVGASGGLFGLMGATLVFGIRRRAAFTPAWRRRFAIVMSLNIGVNVVLGVVIPVVDNAAHAGGFAAGLLLAALASAPRSPPR